MNSEKTNCQQCGQLMGTWLRNCPACNALAPNFGQQPAAAAAGAVDLALQDSGESADPAPGPAMPDLQVFPERMKANRVLAERACSNCPQPIDLGDDVWNCQTCGNTMHAPCHEQSKMCGNPGCASRPQRPVQTAVSRGPAAPAGEMVPCTFCGEMILKKSRKCRFCDEYQNEIDRKANAARLKTDTSDESLTVGEIVFGLMCGFIALITGIVWMMQGKPKGGKLVMIALAAIAVSFFLRSLSHH